MRIIDLLSPEKIALGASAADKAGAIELLVDQAVLEERMKHFVPKKKEVTGYLKRYASLVSGGAYGAILN